MTDVEGKRTSDIKRWADGRRERERKKNLLKSAKAIVIVPDAASPSSMEPLLGDFIPRRPRIGFPHRGNSR